MALNGLLNKGVPVDWATHMIGHELTALHGIDHARTLAIVLPALLNERRGPKRAKLLQYAERVWQIREGDEAHLIEGWRYLGTAGSDEELYTLLGSPRPAFDRDIYKILTKYVGKMIPLSSTRTTQPERS